MKRKIWLLAAVLSLALVGVSRAGDEMIESEGGGSNLTPEMQQFVEPIQFTFQHFTDSQYASLDPVDYKDLIGVLKSEDGSLTGTAFAKMNDFERHTKLEKALPAMRETLQSHARFLAGQEKEKEENSQQLSALIEDMETSKRLMKKWNTAVPEKFSSAYGAARKAAVDHEINDLSKTWGADKALASLNAGPVGAASASATQSKDETNAQKLLKRFDMDKVGKLNVGPNPFGPSVYIGYDTAVAEAIDALKKALKMDERSQHIVLNGLLQYSRQIRASGKESAEHDANEVLGLIYELGAKSSHESVLRSVMQAALADPAMGTWGIEKEYKRYPAWVSLVQDRRLMPETRPLVAAYFLDQAKKAGKIEDKKALIGIARDVVEAPAPVQLADVPPPTLAKRALFTVARHPFLDQIIGAILSRHNNPTHGPVSAFIYLAASALALGGVYFFLRRRASRADIRGPMALLAAGFFIMDVDFFTSNFAIALSAFGVSIVLTIAGAIWGNSVMRKPR